MKKLLLLFLLMPSLVFAQGSGSHITSEAQHPLRHRAERVITDPYATNTGITVQAQLNNIADGLVVTETDPLALKTAGTDNVKDTHIDWGTGATQVNPADFVNQDIGDITITTGDWAVEDDSHAHTGSTLSGSPTFTNVIATNTVSGVTVLQSGVPVLTGNQNITLSGDVSGTGTTAIATVVSDDSHAHTGTTLSGIDISADTNLTAGNHITLTDDDLNVDDDFVLNTSDTMSGSLNVANTVTGSVISLEGGTYDTYLTAGTPTATVYYKLPPADGTVGQSMITNGAGQLSFSSAGAGDMTKAVYDAANVAEQLTGLTATQTLTNKTLTSPKINENVALTTTATKLNYLTSATGTTGTASQKIVFDTSPTLVTPALGVATATSINATGTVTGSVVDLQYLEYSSGGAVTVRDNLTVDGSVTSSGFIGNLTGTATTATNATNIGITDDTTTNATMYPLWVTANTGNLPAKVSSSKITFNPSTATLTTTTFSGALTGTASGNLVSGGALGTPASGTLTNCTFPTLNQDTTGKSAKTDALNSATTVVNVSSATAPSSGQVLTATANNAATWQTPASAGADTALSNLASVAINTSLLSDTDVTDDLGSAAKQWRKVYTPAISFPATQVADAGANVLDDYEEGTWTPTIGGSSIVYAVQSGRYTKIGNVVYFQCHLQLTSGSPTATMSGLPFTVASRGISKVSENNNALSATLRTELTPLSLEGGATIEIDMQASGLAGIPATVASDADIYMNGFYFV